MTRTQDFGTPPLTPRRQMSDGTKETIIGYILVALVAVVVVLGFVVPIIYYVTTVVPVQHQQTYDLRMECLAHHTVKSCEQLTDGVAS